MAAVAAAEGVVLEKKKHFVERLNNCRVLKARRISHLLLSVVGVHGAGDGVGRVRLHLLLVDLLHVLVVVLLLQLPDQHGLLVGVVGELLLGVRAELGEGLSERGGKGVIRTLG